MALVESRTPRLPSFSLLQRKLAAKLSKVEQIKSQCRETSTKIDSFDRTNKADSIADMNFFKRNPIFSSIFFWASCVFVYAGSVNLGGFDFLPAIPFLIFLGWASFVNRGRYLFFTILVVLICAPLYALKKQHGELFLPGLGREFVIDQDFCLVRFESNGENFVLAFAPNEKNSCDESKTGNAKEWRFVPRGLRLKVEKVEVSHADLGEHYNIISDTDLGKLSLQQIDSKFLKLIWNDGSTIQEEDLRRPYFYYPSLLMYWPIIPFSFRI